MSVWAISHVGALTASADTLPGALIQAYVNNPQLNSQRAVVRATDALDRCGPTAGPTASLGKDCAAE
jgi:outer membrane protein